VIRHVLLDADGVLQELPGGWLAAVERYVGVRAAEFLAAAGAAEMPALRGEGDFRVALAEELTRFDVPAPVDQVFREVWQRIEVADSSVDLVAALRDHGLGVHLATNQTAGRAAYMRGELGYDGLFDESFYSCEVGAAKPDSAFFSAAVARLGTTPPEVLLVDDSERNVTAAREVGLAAEHWHLRVGPARLRGLLADHGILL
jgi:putative hydrolase of the HAD superfamily